MKIKARVASLAAGTVLGMFPALGQAEIQFSNESLGWAWVTVYWPGTWGVMSIKATGCVPPRTRQDVGKGVDYAYDTPREDFKIMVEMTNANCQHPVHCKTDRAMPKVKNDQYMPGTLWVTFMANPQTCWLDVLQDPTWKRGSVDAPGQRPPRTPLPAPAPPPPPLGAKGPHLTAGQSITANEYLQSKNNRYYAIQQTDGNLCVYKGTPQGSQGLLWCHNKTMAAGPFITVMQRDGNLCTYKGTPAGYQAGLWCTNAVAPGGQYVLAMQDDGNLCVYTGNPTQYVKGLWCHNQNVGR